MLSVDQILPSGAEEVLRLWPPLRVSGRRAEMGDGISKRISINFSGFRYSTGRYRFSRSYASSRSLSLYISDSHIMVNFCFFSTSCLGMHHYQAFYSAPLVFKWCKLASRVEKWELLYVAESSVPLQLIIKHNNVLSDCVVGRRCIFPSSWYLHRRGITWHQRVRYWRIPTRWGIVSVPTSLPPGQSSRFFAFILKKGDDTHCEQNSFCTLTQPLVSLVWRRTYALILSQMFKTLQIVL